MSPYPEDQLPGSETRSPLGLPLRVGDADQTKVAKIWRKVRHNVHKAQGPHRPSYLVEMPNATAILPYYWQLFPSDFTKYLRQEFCDIHIANFLAEKKVLNWCPGFTKLYPLNATGDGNCLLHAISLALWGVEDTDLWLRKLLHSVMKGEYAGENEARWRRERNSFDTTHIPGKRFRYNTTEWSAEWKIVVDLSDPALRANQAMGLPYECLEEFHIFITANILRRPIIVLAENMCRDATGRSLQPMNFNGIYLPLGWDSKDCYRYPILLGYHQMHFTPLVCTAPSADKEVKDRYCIPMIDHDIKSLPVHFLEAEEEGRETELLQKYLVCETAEICERPVLCARLATDPPKEDYDVFESYLKLAEMRYRMYSEEQYNPENAEALKAAGVMSAVSTQQLNEKMAAVSDPKQGKEPRHAPSEETSEEQVGGLPPWSSDMPTEDSVCISSTALLSSGPKVPPMKHQLYGYSGRTNLACKKTGCPYYRAVESDEYCERCYKALSSVGKEAFKKCRVDSCLNGGDRRYDGLCQVCYDQNAFMNEDAVGVPHPAGLQDLSTSPKFSGLSTRGPVLFDSATIQDGNEMEVDEEKAVSSALDTNVVNEFKVGSKQCIVPGCDFTGNPNYDGLCNKCFQLSKEAGKRSVGGAGSLGFLDSSPPHEIPVTVGKKKCLMPECELTGHPEKGDLCSGCYSKQTELSKAAGLLNAGGESHPLIPDTNHPEISRRLSTERQKQLMEGRPQRCRTPDCEMFAHPSQNGFCSACYKKSVAGKSSPHDFSGGLSSPQQKHPRDEASTFRPILHFTVQKNMCAVPGCNGVRLRLGTGELCHAHYQDSVNRYSPTTRTPTPPGAVTRAEMPSVSGKVQPSAPPQSIYASQPGFRPSGMSNIGVMQHPAEPAEMARTSSRETCAHPTCSNPAVPPAYVACRSCLEFVKKVNRFETAFRSVRGETTAPSAFRLPSSDDDLSPIAIEAVSPYDPPTETVRNLDIHEKPSSGFKGKFQYDHIKRVKCQAKRGCPNGSYGNPSYGNLCAACFDRDVVQMHKASSSSSVPLKQPSRSHTLPPRSQSAKISGTTTSTTLRTSSRPSNYQKCFSSGCENQANVQIMEGYCRECYPAYKSRDHKKRSPVSPARRSTPSEREKPARTGDDLFTTTAPKCLTKNCSNYGNSQSRGFCNDCFRRRMKP